MSETQISYLAEKVFIHHWPKDSPLWDESLQKKFDECINKNSNSKKIIVLIIKPTGICLELSFAANH